MQVVEKNGRGERLTSFDQSLSTFWAAKPRKASNGKVFSQRGCV
jgi:hypothetical protein